MLNNKSFLVIWWFGATFCFASSAVNEYVDSDFGTKRINEVTNLLEFYHDNATVDNQGSCQDDEDCLPGGFCHGRGKAKFCDCFQGTRGDHCEIVDECVKNPTKCGSGTDVKCTYNPNSRIAYCRCSKGKRFDVPQKKCVEQKPCQTYKDCYNGGQCEGKGETKYCWCKPGTSGDFCERIEECHDDPTLCGKGPDVECRFNTILERAYCHCFNGTQRFDLPQKKCLARKTCVEQKECNPWGACTDKCQGFEPCRSNEYFESLYTCHCIEGTSGDKCEIVNYCYTREVDCGSGSNVTCTFWYVSGFKSLAYCKCEIEKQSFDAESKLCKDCDCGTMSYGCSFDEGKKRCSCKFDSYDTGDTCEDCKCGEGSDGCTFFNGKKQCYCKSGYLLNNEICERCDCGNNSTGCRFENGLKMCSCEPGFAVGSYGSCTPMCSDKLKCANGGLCLQDICVCSAGTGGPFCETVYECEDNLCGEKNDVYCRYDNRLQKAYCACQNIDATFDAYDKSCKMCECDYYHYSWESCEYVRGKKVCHCKKDYAHHPIQEKCVYCNCRGNSTCDFDSNGNQVCICKDSFKEWKGTCFECDCGQYGTFCNFDKTISTRTKVCTCRPGYEDYKGTCVKCECGANGKCLYSAGHLNRCDCNPGYAQDSTNRCTLCDCGPDSKCKFLHKTKVCSCAEGYQGSKGYCRDIDECLDPQSCPQPGMRCVNTPGSFSCECKPGYFQTLSDKVHPTFSPMCTKPEETPPNYRPWKIGYGILSGGFILIIIGLVVIIFKVRRNAPCDSGK